MEARCGEVFIPMLSLISRYLINVRTANYSAVAYYVASILAVVFAIGAVGCTLPTQATQRSADQADLPTPVSVTIKKTPSNGRLYVYGHRAAAESFITCNDFEVQVRDLKTFEIKWSHKFTDPVSSASFDANDDLVVVGSVFDILRLQNGGKSVTTWLPTKELDARDIWAGTVLDVTDRYALVDDSRRLCFAKISLVKRGQVERTGLADNSPIEKFMDARINASDLALVGIDKSKKCVYLRKSSKEPVR
jgi:hypothetical protein